MQRPIVLVGYYGMLNFGDDLFVSLICSLRPRLDPSRMLWVVAPPSSQKVHPGTRFLVPNSLASMWRSHGWRGSVLRLAVSLFAATFAHTLVMGGGSVLTEVQGVRAQQLKLRRFLRISRWMALGVSVGPVKNGSRSQVDDLVDVLETIIVRDRRSVTDSARGAELGGDLAGLIPIAGYDLDRSRLRAGIIYAPKESWTAEAQHLLIGPIAAHASHTGTVVTVMALNCHEQEGDINVCGEAMAEFKRLGVSTKQTSYEALGLGGTVQALASASCVVTGRLHGGIVAFVTETPFLLISDSPKMDDFLNDIGAPLEYRGRLDSTGVRAVEAILRSPAPVISDWYVERAIAVYLRPSSRLGTA